MANSTIQQLSILQELELSIETIKSSLSVIQSIQHQKTPVFLIFLILSTGIERLLKIVIGLRLMSDGRPFPTENELKGKEYGHNLVSLKNKLLSVCFSSNALVLVPAVNDDKIFLESDALINEILKQLSEFALKDRYIYMNRIANENSTGVWLSARWSEIEEKIVPKETAIKLIMEGKEDEYKELISINFVGCIERFLRAICRTITLGKMDSDANSAGTLLYDFLFLRDADLGKKKYDLFGYSLS